MGGNREEGGVSRTGAPGPVGWKLRQSCLLRIPQKAWPEGSRERLVCIGRRGLLPLAFKSAVEQLYTQLVTVEYSNLVSEKACIAAIERTPTYCISAGDLEKKGSSGLLWVISHSGIWTKRTQNKVPLNGVPSSGSLLSAAWQARGREGEPTPPVPMLPFHVWPLNVANDPHGDLDWRGAFSRIWR